MFYPVLMVTDITLIDKVNSFYEISWNHLLVFSGALFTIIGVVIPILFQIYQSQVFRSEEEKIKNLIKSQTSKSKKELEESQNSLFESYKKEVAESVKQLSNGLMEILENKEKKLTMHIDDVIGGVLMVQANFFYANEQYYDAAESEIRAIISLCEAEAEATMRRAVNSLVDDILPSLRVGLIEDSEDFYSLVEDVKKSISELNINHRYDYLLVKIKNAVAEMEKRG